VVIYWRQNFPGLDNLQEDDDDASEELVAVLALLNKVVWEDKPLGRI